MAQREFESTLSEIRQHLQRLGANNVQVSLTDDFEPRAGTLVRIDYEGAYWHLLPTRLLEILRDLKDGGGGGEVRSAIERGGHGVWHGPSPPDSRAELT